jgi:hypothetical protein
MSLRLFPYGTLAKYPHMKPEDVAVWERFIKQNPKFFDTCAYDVAIGEGAPQNPEHPAEIQYDGKVLTQKKVDIVAFQGSLVYLIEVKPVADMRALGQILVYAKLFAHDYITLGAAQKMIICGEVERELEPLFADHDIIIEEA